MGNSSHGGRIVVVAVIALRVVRFIWPQYQQSSHKRLMDKKTDEKIPSVASRVATRRVEMPPRKTLPADVSLIQYIRAVVHQPPRRKAE
jgi:hypothetical protein